MKFSMLLGAAFLLASCDTLEEIVRDIPSGPPATQAPATVVVTGQTVKVFSYGVDKLAQEPDGAWAAYYGNGQLKSLLREDARSDGAVVLIDFFEEDGRWRTFDVAGRQITYAAMGPNDRYPESKRPIISVSAVASPRYDASDVNGRNAKRVDFGKGLAFFYQGHNGAWYRPDSISARYKETARDDSSIYLEGTDGEQIQLDLHRKMISRAPAGQPRQDAMPIKTAYRHARAGLDAANAFAGVADAAKTVKTIWFAGSKKVLVQENEDNWSEYEGTNRTTRWTTNRMSSWVDMPGLMNDRGQVIFLDFAGKAILGQKEDFAIDEMSTAPHRP